MMPDQYTEERRHTKLTTGEKWLIAIPFLILLFFVWFLGVIGMIGTERTYLRTKIPSGIEGCRVWLGSTLEEIYNIMGEPDWVSGERYEEMFDSKEGTVGYKDQTILGRNASISFRLDRNLEEENARVILINVEFIFSEEEECSVAAQELQEHFRGTYAGDENFCELLSYGPSVIDAPWNNRISRYAAGASSRPMIVINQYPLRIDLESKPDNAYAEPTAPETWNRRNIGGIVIVSAFLLLAGVFLVRDRQKDPAK